MDCPYYQPFSIHFKAMSMSANPPLFEHPHQHIRPVAPRRAASPRCRGTSCASHGRDHRLPWLQRYPRGSHAARWPSGSWRAGPSWAYRNLWKIYGNLSMENLWKSMGNLWKSDFWSGGIQVRDMGMFLQAKGMLKHTEAIDGTLPIDGICMGSHLKQLALWHGSHNAARPIGSQPRVGRAKLVWPLQTCLPTYPLQNIGQSRS